MDRPGIDDDYEEALRALKRRSRRRLIGAVVVVVGVLGLLWYFLGSSPPEPRVSPPALAALPTLPPTHPSNADPLPPPALPSASTGQPPARLIDPPLPSDNGVAHAGQGMPPASTGADGIANSAMATPSSAENFSPPPPAAGGGPSPTPSMPAAPVRPQAPTRAAQSAAPHSTSPAPAHTAPTARKPAPTTAPSKSASKTPVRSAQTKPKPTKPATQNTSHGRQFLVIGTFVELSRAQNIVQRTQKLHLPVHSEPVLLQGKKAHRVTIGPFTSTAEVQAARRKIGQAGLHGKLITR